MTVPGIPTFISVTAVPQASFLQDAEPARSEGNGIGPAQDGSSDQNRATSAGNEERHTRGYAAGTKQRAADGRELSAQEIQQLQKLKAIDRQVRAHERAHMAAGGPYVRGGASYQYEQGPDGRRYAVAGEVSIDTSEEQDPRATIRKMDTVIKAALAPAEPSAQDRAVAAAARMKKARAQMELSGGSSSPASVAEGQGMEASRKGTKVDSSVRAQDEPVLPKGALVNVYA